MGAKKISQAGLEFIARWEGIVLHPYLDIASLWTIGVGHLIKPTDVFSTITNEQIKDLLKNADKNNPIASIKIPETEALQILSNDVEAVEKSLLQNIKVPLTQNQFDSLVSFGFNCGAGVFKTSEACKVLNEGKYGDVPTNLLSWSKVRINGVLKVSQGLLSRRKAEGQLFAKPDLQSVVGINTIVSLTPDAVYNIQTKLKNLGFYKGKVDGISGPLTKEAIEKFSEKFGVSNEVSNIGVTTSWLDILNNV